MMDSDRVGIWYTDGNMDEVTVSGRVEGMDMPGPPDAKVRLETDKGIFTIPFAGIPLICLLTYTVMYGFRP